VRRARLLPALLGAALVAAVPASASGWLPHPPKATWTYQWADTTYSPTATNEKVWVASTGGNAFKLAWSSEDKSLANGDGTVAGTGTLRFQDTLTGVINTDWSGTAPPAGFPRLCAVASTCGNSLAGSYYNLIWGSSVPVLTEPLMFGATWTSHGGAHNDIRSTNRLLGIQQVKTPAFSKYVFAAKIESHITQRGNPYGSGTRTVWWVWGIGPVWSIFDHADAKKSVTTVVLMKTSLKAKAPPILGDYFPLGAGTTGIYNWTNSRYLDKPVVERITSTGGGRFAASTVSGPIQMQGNYRYDVSTDGLANISATTKSASLALLPGLGPKRLPPGKRRRFVTPFDLMNFGLNPLFPAYPQAGETWKAAASGHDFKLYGVTGSSRVVGFQYVDVPAGRYLALVVRSTLKQRGFPFGSGTRTTWFAPGLGMVKLVFKHGDGSVSVVTRLV
jgi:hypothetical protein